MKEEKFPKEVIEEAIQGLVDKKDQVDVQRLAHNVDLPNYFIFPYQADITNFSLNLIHLLT